LNKLIIKLEKLEKILKEKEEKYTHNIYHIPSCKKLNKFINNSDKKINIWPIFNSFELEPTLLKNNLLTPNKRINITYDKENKNSISNLNSNNEFKCLDIILNKNKLWGDNTLIPN